MTCKETQEEELEVLQSIYDGDSNFKELSPTSFQYMIGDEGDARSFLLEITWGEKYPDVVPTISLDTFYNKKIIPEVKEEIINKILAEADLLLGTAMTYTLIEWAKEHAASLTIAQPEKLISSDNSFSIENEPSLNGQIAIPPEKVEKKPKLSKQQKRKLYEKLDSKGERPRGWDWVDIVKHLSQTSSKSATSDT